MQMAQVNFLVDHLYPADLGQLWVALGQREYVERKYRALGSVAVRILDFDVSEKTIAVSLERQVRVPAEAMSAWKRLLSSGRPTLHHESHWKRVASDRIDTVLDIWPVGWPVRARGSGTVVELSAACTQMKLAFTVQCDVPAIGATIARFFADQMKHALAADHRFTVDYLAGTGTADVAGTVSNQATPIGQDAEE